MAKERPAMDLDLRARHDSAGAKVGKVTSYDVSELRAIELLEQVRSARSRELSPPHRRPLSLSERVRPTSRLSGAHRARARGSCARR